VKDWVAAEEGGDPIGLHGYYPPVDYRGLVEPTAISDLGNLQFGDCVLAAIFHHLQFWTESERKKGLPIAEVLPKTSEALIAYKQVNPAFNPFDGSGDDGCEPLDAFKLAMSKGFVAGGQYHILAGFAEIEPEDLAGLKYAIQNGCGVVSVMNLPAVWEGEIESWKVEVQDWPANPLAGESAPASWGPHAVYTVGHGPEGFLVNSWGSWVKLSAEAMLAYGQRHYFLVWDSLQKIGELDAIRLRQDIIRLREGLLQS